MAEVKYIKENELLHSWPFSSRIVNVFNFTVCIYVCMYVCMYNSIPNFPLVLHFLFRRNQVLVLSLTVCIVCTRTCPYIIRQSRHTLRTYVRMYVVPIHNAFTAFSLTLRPFDSEKEYVWNLDPAAVCAGAPCMSFLFHSCFILIYFMGWEKHRVVAYQKPLIKANRRNK